MLIRHSLMPKAKGPGGKEGPYLYMNMCILGMCNALDLLTSEYLWRVKGPQ